MQPPEILDVLDKNQGFTAVTKLMGKPAPSWFVFRDMVSRPVTLVAICNGIRAHRFDTLWRPGAVLKKDTLGYLVHINELSFFQNNNDVTLAFYKVKGYNFLVACWFDNKTGERIA